MKIRRSLWLVFAPVAVLSLFAPSASANNPIVIEPTDFWFDYAEPTQFIAQTYMSDGYPSDPMLWLYDEQNNLLAQNDDSFGLQSYISYAVPAGRYRLRAGICCGDPNAWRTNGGWNLQYELGFNGVGQTSTTTSTSTTTTTTSTTTTTTTTTTTLPATTTTQTPTTTTSEPAVYTSTTTQPPVTTSAVPSTTSTTTSTTTLAPTSTTTTIATSTETTTPTTVPATEQLATILDNVGAVEINAIVNILEMPDISQAEVASAVQQILEQEITSEQATELATSEKVLSSIDAEQASAIFDAIDINNIDITQAAAIVEAVQNAPVAVRAEFEDKIDVFNGKTDTYIPLGSSVNIGVRRVLIVSASFMIAIPAPPPPISRKQ